MKLNKLTQEQNEALVGLLILVYRADKKISLSEQDFLNKVEDQLNWDSPTDFDGYCAQAVSLIRGDNKESTVQQWVEVLQPVKNSVADIFTTMAIIDGDYSAAEESLLKQLNLTK